MVRGWLPDQTFCLLAMFARTQITPGEKDRGEWIRNPELTMYFPPAKKILNFQPGLKELPGIGKIKFSAISRNEAL